MFRLVLIAYLSFATAFSSLFCCCNLRQLFAKSATASCCNSDVLRTTSCPNCQAEKSEDDATVKAPLPCNGHGRCACAVRQARLLPPAVVVGEAGDSWSWNTADAEFSPDVFLTSALPSLEALLTRFREKQRPAKLYGREILRAYQILRC
jgi:hypothetical protein